MSKKTEDILAEVFTCQYGHDSGAIVERIAVTGTGFSRFVDVQHHLYAYVSCATCGYTEIFSLKVLEGKEDPGKFLDTLFALKALKS